MYKLGFSTIGCPDYSVDQVAQLASANGYSGVELRLIRGEVDLPALEEFSPREIGATARRFADAGVEVVCVDTSVEMCSVDAEVRKAQYDSAQRHCDIALALGAPMIRVFGGSLPDGQSVDETRSAIVEGLTQVADYSSSCGVASVLEMHDDFSSSESVIDLFARGVSDSLGVLWDTFHTYRRGESPAHTWGRLGSKIKHVHVKDGIESPSTTRGYEYRLTGHGTIPVAGFLDVLRSGGYSGYVNFEWEKAWHPTIEEPEVAIPHFARYHADYVATR